MFTKKTIIATIVSFSATALMGSQVANATTETGTAQAVIQTAIAVTQSTILDFATILPDAAGDNVTLTSLSAISSSSGNSAFFGTPTAGSFSVNGDANSVVTLQFSTGNTLTGAGDAIPLNNFTTPTLTPTTDGSGNVAFDVGATIAINANQTPGLYTGNYTVTVAYQ